MARRVSAVPSQRLGIEESLARAATTRGMRAVKRRKYHSPLRQDQVELTRKRIVQAIIEQLADASLSDFSVARVAERAGVSEATVYRNFADRESMLQAVAQHWQESYEVPRLRRRRRRSRCTPPRTSSSSNARRR